MGVGTMVVFPLPPVYLLSRRHILSLSVYQANETRATFSPLIARGPIGHVSRRPSDAPELTTDS